MYCRDSAANALRLQQNPECREQPDPFCRVEVVCVSLNNRHVLHGYSEHEYYFCGIGVYNISRQGSSLGLVVYELVLACSSD